MRIPFTLPFSILPISLSMSESIPAWVLRYELNKIVCPIFPRRRLISLTSNWTCLINLTPIQRGIYLSINSSFPDILLTSKTEAGTSIFLFSNRFDNLFINIKQNGRLLRGFYLNSFISVTACEAEIRFQLYQPVHIILRNPSGAKLSCVFNGESQVPRKISSETQNQISFVKSVFWYNLLPKLILLASSIAE